MSHSYRHHLTVRPLDFWLARGAVLIIVTLQISIVNDLTMGPPWLAPALEIALLIPLWDLVARDVSRVRMLAIVLTGLVTLMNFGALARLIHAILAGDAGSGRTLLGRRKYLDDECHYLRALVLGP